MAIEGINNSPGLERERAERRKVQVIYPTKESQNQKLSNRRKTIFTFFQTSSRFEMKCGLKAKSRPKMKCGLKAKSRPEMMYGAELMILTDELEAMMEILKLFRHSYYGEELSRVFTVLSS
jgi:hypothetical protein